MKMLLLCAVAATTLLGGCVLPAPPALVTVQTEPVYQPGYVVTTLPYGYRTVRYHRGVYYSHNNVYYRRNPHGYVVVTRPY